MNTAKATAQRLRSMFGRLDRDVDAAQVLSGASADCSADARAHAAGVADLGPGGPKVEQVPDIIRIMLGGRTLARSDAALRIVGVGQDVGAQVDPGAASYFLPASDVEMNRLHPSEREGRSDWGGRIAYFHLGGPNGLIRDAVWFFPEPRPEFEAIRLHLAFFARAVDEVWVGRQRLLPGADTPQGGWALPRVPERVRPV